MEKNDQMPSGGCGVCGKYDGMAQWVLRKRLRWNGSTWICWECHKLENKRGAYVGHKRETWGIRS
jgi:hypothetical protein